MHLVKSQLTFNWMPTLNEYNRCWTGRVCLSSYCNITTQRRRGVSRINATLVADSCTCILLDSCQNFCHFEIKKIQMRPIFLNENFPLKTSRFKVLVQVKQHGIQLLHLQIFNLTLGWWEYANHIPSFSHYTNLYKSGKTGWSLIIQQVFSHQ